MIEKGVFNVRPFAYIKGFEWRVIMLILKNIGIILVIQLILYIGIFIMLPFLFISFGEASLFVLNVIYGLAICLIFGLNLNIALRWLPVGLIFLWILILVYHPPGIYGIRGRDAFGLDWTSVEFDAFFVASIILICEFVILVSTKIIKHILLKRV
jgi:hypothetical protein